MSTPSTSQRPSKTRQIKLESTPSGVPKESDFTLEEAAMPEVGEGQVLVQARFISVDPYLRGRISGVKTYIDPILPGDLMEGGVVGQVVESRSKDYNAGDFVQGFLKWQEYVAVPAGALQPVDASVAPPSTALGVLGIPGFTAYFGLLDICQPQAGDAVVVSGAAGAVGSAVVQIAKIKGCRVVGIAGTDEKVKWLTKELGADAAFNYKTVEDTGAKLKELCPYGIDCYFDNVGGPITDAVFPLMNNGGRVSVCGLISQYNKEKPEPGPRPFPWILIRQLKVQGFIVFRFADRYPEAYREMSQWIKEGKLKYAEQVTDGFENLPKAFIAMLGGANTGKMLVRVD